MSRPLPPDPDVPPSRPPSGARSRLDPRAGRASSASEGVPPFGLRVTVDEVRRELELVHRAELASLFQEAAAVRVRSASLHGTIATFPHAPPGLVSWRRRATTLLGHVRVEGLELPGTHRLERLLAERPGRWPGAVRLLQLARRLEDTESVRTSLGYALLCEGRPAPAEALFSDLLRRAERLRFRWRVLEGLGLAHAAQGRWRLALGAVEAAADDPRCEATVLVEALHLALLVGDPARTRRAAARLDLLEGGGTPAYAASLAMIRRRRGRLPRPEGEAARELERSAACPSSSGRVARATLEAVAP